MTFFKTSFVRIFSVFITAFILVLSAKQYGAEGRGSIAACLNIVTIAATLGGVSAGRTILFLITGMQLGAREFYNRYLCSILALLSVLTAVVAAGIGLVHLVKPELLGKINPRYLVLFMLSLPYYLWLTLNSIVFSSLGRIDVQNRIVLKNRALFLVVASAAMFAGAPIFAFIAILVAFNTLNLVGELVWLLRHLEVRWRVEAGVVRDMLLNGCKIHIDTLGGLLIGSANLMIVNYYLTQADVGVFELASQFISIIMILPMVVQLQINTEIADKGPDGAWPAQKRYIKLMFGLLAVGGAACYLLLPPFIHAVLGESYRRAVDVFNILLIGVAGNCLSLLMGPQWMARGKFKTISALTTVLGAAGFLAAIFLVPRLGVVGAAHASNLSYGIALVCNVVYFLHLNRNIVPARAAADPA